MLILKHNKLKQKELTNLMPRSMELTQSDPFSYQAASAEQFDPFTRAAGNPFETPGMLTAQVDPFAQQQPYNFNAPAVANIYGQSDPFAQANTDPFGQQSNFDPFGQGGNNFNTGPQMQESIPDGRPQLSERLANQIGRVKEVGGKALDLVMGGTFGAKAAERAGQASTALNVAEFAAGNYGNVRQDMQNAWGNKEQHMATAMNVGKGAAIETGRAGKDAVVNYLMNHYGLEKRMDDATGDEKIRIAKKFKFGRRVVGTMLNPAGKASRLAMGAAKEARKAVKQEAFNQLGTIRANRQEAAYNYYGNMAA